VFLYGKRESGEGVSKKKRKKRRGPGHKLPVKCKEPQKVGKRRRATKRKISSFFWDKMRLIRWSLSKQELGTGKCSVARLGRNKRTRRMAGKGCKFYKDERVEENYALLSNVRVKKKIRNVGRKS